MKLQHYGHIRTVLSERRTRKHRIFVRLQTTQANTGRRIKTPVEQVKRVDSLPTLLYEKVSFNVVCWSTNFVTYQ